MFKWLSDAWTRWSTEGLRVPFVFDPITKKPSVTLAQVYISFTACIISIAFLHWKASLLTASIVTGVWWVLATVLYLLRNLQKAKFNVKSGEIDLESDDDPPKPADNEEK